MANVTLLGADYADVPAVMLPKTGGGQAEFWDMDTDLSYIGVNAEWLQKVFQDEYALEDTDYNGWTASTTAKAIVATQTLSPTFSANMNEYEYVLRWRFRFDRVSLEGATLKAVPDIECNDLYQVLVRRPNSLANIGAMNPAGNSCLTLLTTPLLVYYSTSGARTYTFSTSYGFYISATAATFSSSTGNTPNVTIKTPAINARCNSTYFATARAPEIDQANSTCKLRGDLYRMRKGSFLRGAYLGVCDIFNNDVPTA